MSFIDVSKSLNCMKMYTDELILKHNLAKNHLQCSDCILENIWHYIPFAHKNSDEDTMVGYKSEKFTSLII